MVVLVTRLDQPTFDKRYGDLVEPQNGEIVLQAKADSSVTFIEFDAPPGFEYRFRTHAGEPVADRQASVGEGGGYVDAATGEFAPSSVTFNHYIPGPRMTEADAASLLGSEFRIDRQTCRVQPAVRVCSGSESDLEGMLQKFKRSEAP